MQSVVSPARSSSLPHRDAGTPVDLRAINDTVRTASSWISPLRLEMGRVLVGQTKLVDRLLVALLSGGHVLLEGLPGLAKTLALKTLAGSIDASFKRIQFTPDMLPADIVGTLIFDPRTGEYRTRRGPVFASFVLADEINRAPAKVQSALLEAMQEHHVTLGDETHRLPDPFLVMATQNPVEQEGTYPLPEAQIDRFMLKVVVGYPTPHEERQILDAMARSAPRLSVSRVVGVNEITAARAVLDSIYIDDRLKDYIVSLVAATREPRDADANLKALIRTGASPRATIALALAARACAFMNGRGFVLPQDIKEIAPDVLRHRVATTYEAEAERVTSDHIVSRILDTVVVP